MATLLNKDDEMLDRMEEDLIAKCVLAFADAGVTQNVHGVFSLDELEAKSVDDLCKKVGVGVAYAGAEPFRNVVQPKSSNPNQLNPGREQAVKGVNFTYSVILAVPAGTMCEEERKTATKLLTVLRRRILGTPITGDVANRTWIFAGESPQISESTSDMLFYVQLWRVQLIIAGPVSP